MRRAGRAAGRPKRSAEWQPLKPKLVVEVCYDHFTGERFRHGTRLLRWRPDKAPRQCTMDQVKQKKANLMKLLNGVRRRRGGFVAADLPCRERATTVAYATGLLHRQRAVRASTSPAR